MWCRRCNMETNGKVCPVCGTETIEDLPTEIFWCKECRSPIIYNANAVDKGICPICGKKTRYMAQDLRPVFPEERLLMAVLLDRDPNEFMREPIWSANSRYYTGNKSFVTSTTLFQTADTDTIGKKVKELTNHIDYAPFNEEIAKFVRANQHRLSYLKDEQKKVSLRLMLDQLNENGQILIGDVAFQTRSELEKCEQEAGDEWDDEEIYFVVDDFTVFLGREYPVAFNIIPPIGPISVTTLFRFPVLRQVNQLSQGLIR